MKKKFAKILCNIFIAIFVIIAIIGDVNMANANEPDKLIEKHEKYNFAASKSDVWTPTFQLCWNELINLIDRNNKIEFVNGNSVFADELNKQKFLKENLNSNSLYIKVGKMTLNLKKQIENDINSKFNTTSDILNNIVFNDVQDDEINLTFIYPFMLKDFSFKTAFTDISSQSFLKEKKNKFKFFGLSSDEKIKNKQLENIKYLFYENDNDFALKIYNADKSQEMILYSTNSNLSFDDIYWELIKKLDTTKKSDAMITNDIKIPYLSINEKINYNEFAEKHIKGKWYDSNSDSYWWVNKNIISTIKFNLNNNGANLKSEAVISEMGPKYLSNHKFSLKRNYHFDRPFVLFIKETNQDKPYFALKVKNGKYLIKEKASK